MMRIYFARHGESQANTAHEMSNRGLKHPLTHTGREQASLLARKLEGQSITRIYSSPVLRAIETSVIVAHHLGVEYEVSEALREYDVGYLEGRSDKEAWQLWQKLFDAWAKDRRWDERIEGGESFCDVKNRFVPFVDSLIQQHGRSEANLLCIAHGGLYWMMLPLVLRNIDTDFLYKQHGFPHTALIVSELTHEGLVCVEWNGTRLSTSTDSVRRIRPFRDADEADVVAVWHRSGLAAYTYLPTWPALTIEAAQVVFHDIILAKCAIWVGTLDEKIVAFLAINGSYIDRMYADPSEWRKGWGTRFIRLAKQLSPHGLELHTHQENHAARALYERHGFRAVKFGTSPPPESAPDVEYHWRPQAVAWGEHGAQL